MVRVHVFNKEGKLVGPIDSPKVVKSDADWQKQLTRKQYEILRAKGTEQPFCGLLLDNKKEGVYTCVGCGLPLFASNSKFQSGTGWPSFFQPIAKENITEHSDRAYGMVRTEILCARCDGHLGHVFNDGPKPTGLRYCLNSESLSFTAGEDLAQLADAAADAPPAATQPAPGNTTGSATGNLAAAALVPGIAAAPAPGSAAAALPGKATAVFAGGCFWCTEAVFDQLKGVTGVESGYAGGKPETANYEAVCSGRTGHAEVIRITFEPAVISFDQLLDIFFAAHDPTQLNRQGNDVGTQYRSAIFYSDEEQKQIAQKKIAKLTAAKAFYRPIVTTLEPLTGFYVAENYHQDYARLHPEQPYIACHATPNVAKVRKEFSAWFK